MPIHYILHQLRGLQRILDSLDLNLDFTARMINYVTHDVSTEMKKDVNGFFTSVYHLDFILEMLLIIKFLEILVALIFNIFIQQSPCIGSLFR